MYFGSFYDITQKVGFSLLQKGPKFPPKCPSLSTLQLLKESVMSSVRTLQEETVQKSTRKPKKFYNTSRTRRGPLTTPPERNGRPSKPSGKTPPMWF